MSNQSVAFNSQEDDIRTVKFDGELWFVLKDLCVRLGIEDLDQVVRRLDKDGVRLADVTDSLGRARSVRVINRPNLISFLSRSNKPEAFSLLDRMYQQVIAASGSLNVALLQAQNAQLAQQNLKLLEQSQDTMKMFVQRLSDEVSEGAQSSNPENRLMQKADLEDWMRIGLRYKKEFREMRDAKKVTPAQFQAFTQQTDQWLKVVEAHLKYVEDHEPEAWAIWGKAYFGVQDVEKQQKDVQAQLETLQGVIQEYQTMLPAGQQQQIESPQQGE